ncbi:MAG: DUF2442 domain-containing protein [Chloroflexi bacterium]|nr:DUF2442 domain-containing protein [Chloroflexota bacterium]
MAIVVAVKALELYRVWLKFSTGEERVVDLLPLMRGPIFEPMRSNADYFRTVRVDSELGTIVWENGADLDPDVLYGSHQPAWMDAERTPV